MRAIKIILLFDFVVGAVKTKDQQLPREITCKANLMRFSHELAHWPTIPW